jgi:hypothetical protein
MLKIRSLKIQINTDKGLYGLYIEFKSGLNIVRGNNSSGKSTIFQSILYCLGMEELIGGKNEKAMQSVLKDEVLNDEKKKEAIVIESSVLMEIENEEIITIERYIKSSSKSSKLVKVYSGALLSGENKELQSIEMYVHDPGSATDTEFGYLAYLEKFLGYELPIVQYNDNALRKLYLQNIFPAFVIEQKAGWSEFLATIPYYNLRDKERRAIEFILNLDSWNIEEKKQEIKMQKQDLIEEWGSLSNQINEVARRSATEVNGLTEMPSILNELNGVFLTYSTPDKTFSLSDYLEQMRNELKQIEEAEIPRIAEISQQKEEELNALNTVYRRYNVQYDLLNNQKGTAESNLEIIQQRLQQIKEELYQNKQHSKLKTLGAAEKVKTALDECPACGQTLNDVLLPQEASIVPMNIEENILYLTSQQLMAETYINNHKIDIDNFASKLRTYEVAIAQQREKIRAIKRDLVTDDRMPSVELIERRIKLRNRLEFYLDIQKQFLSLNELLKLKSDAWVKVLRAEGKLPKESFSHSDFSKLKFLKTNFIRLLKSFDYGSKSLDDLDITKDKLIPVANGGYSIKFDSSASDLMRAIFAYTCALYLTSQKFHCNHPSFIMFDEPGGQETAISTLRDLLKELQQYSAQSIVFASFKQSESDFKESTEGVEFNLIESATGKKFIKRLTTIES